jgi:glycosyltransferase involved in cell wall biosynthesis
VFTRRGEAHLPDELLTEHGYRVVHVPAGPPRYVPKEDLLQHMGEFARFLQARWTDEKPDVVHSHYWMSGLAAVSAARIAGVPVVHAFHTLGVVKRRYEGDDDTSPPQRIATEKMIGREAARIVATSTDEISELTRMGVPRSRISLVPGGVDADWFVPEGDTELVIAGGPDKAELADDEHARFLRSFAESMEVGNQVKLVGRVSRDTLPALLRSADAVVCTPWYEPFGIVPLEAMACGVPVVASAVGGLSDTVVDGITGALVPPRKPRALAGTLHHLLAHRATREQLGAAGRDRAWARYSWQRVAAETMRAYVQAGAVDSSIESAIEPAVEHTVEPTVMSAGATPGPALEASR